MTSIIAIPAYAVVLYVAALLVLLLAVVLLWRRSRHAADACDTLFDVSSEGQLLLDSTGRIVKANDAALGLFNVDAQELEGHPFQELLMDPDFSPDDPWDIAKGPDQRLPYVFQGTECRGSINALVDFRPLRYGSRELLLVAINDQSGVRRLQSCQARLYAMYENGFQGIAVLQEGIFVYANKLFERFCGISLGQLSEQSAQEVFHPLDQEFVWQELTQGARCEEANRCFSCRLQRPDDTEVWVRVTIVCMQWEQRPALFCFFLDISALKALEGLRIDLQDLDNADTRTPLASVIDLPRRILQANGLSPEQEQRLRAVEQAGYVLLRTLHHSLDAYRMGVGSYEFAPGPVDLASLLERICEDVVSGKGEVTARVKLDCDGLQPAGAARVLVAGDAMLLHTLFYDSAQAACSCARPDGRVTCRCLSHTDTAEVLFAVRAEPGANIQAPLAARIAALHHGAVQVCGIAPDTLELSVKLPCFRPEKDGENLAETHPVIAPWPRGRLLVAAADAAQFAACKAQLAHLPYVVDLVASGSQAVAQYTGRIYDLVCVDMRMADGLEAVQQIRSFEQQSGRGRVPIVGLLGTNGDPSDRSYFEVGCQAVLPQPFEAGQLLALIQRFSPQSSAAPASADK